MKRDIFFKWNRLGQKQELIDELSKSVYNLLQEQWNVLPTPIILDNDIVDLLLVNAEGQLCVVHVLEDNAIKAQLGKILLDYFSLNDKLHKLQQAFSQVKIDINRRLHLKLFIPGLVKELISGVADFSLPIEYYDFCFIQSSDQSGILLEKIDVEQDRNERQDFSSLLKILGENVRSDNSVVSPLEDVSQHQNEAHTHPTIHGDEIQVDTLSDKNVLLNEVEDDAEIETFFDRAKLSENELVSFFELEKKLDEFRRSKEQRNQ